MSSSTADAVAARPRGLRVVVVADQALTGEAVRTALTGHGFEFVGLSTPDTLTHARELGRRVDELSPDVGLLMQELDDPLHFRDALAVLRAVGTAEWLLLTGAADQARWGAGIEAGASAVMPMTIGLDRLAEALNLLASGAEVMTQAERDRLLALWQERSAELRALTDRMERLSPREMEILRALCDGRSVTAIASVGEVSVDTVRGQVKSVLKKLEVNSQLAAVAAYQRLSRLTRVE
ncbi:MAG: response regulator transcription factor [Nocardioides sp.]|nr:response regulator transcription factor [Nocardioides sp.]